MATVSALVYDHHRKSDGSFNVEIRVFHRKKKYIDTPHFVTDRRLEENGEIKDPFILKQVNQQLDDYRETISGLGNGSRSFPRRRCVTTSGTRTSLLILLPSARKSLPTGKRTVRVAASSHFCRNTVVKYRPTR